MSFLSKMYYLQIKILQESFEFHLRDIWDNLAHSTLFSGCPPYLTNSPPTTMNV